MSSTRFKRSNNDQMLAGVCGGLGGYLGIDSTLVRFGFVMLTLASGVGIPIYFLLMVIAPSETPFDDIEIRFPGEDEPETAVSPQPQSLSETAGENNKLVAFGLIGVGAVMMIGQFGWFSAAFVWPVLLIGFGAYLVVRQR